MSTNDKIISINELSKKTLKKYINKSVDNARSFGTPSEKHINGIVRAKKKLAIKENVISELSSDLLGKYIHHAAPDAMNNAVNAQIEFDKNRFYDFETFANKGKKRLKGVNIATRKLVKKAIKEDAIMGVGNGDPAHVTNPTDNYSAQRSQRKQGYKKILRRKKSVR